MVRRSPPWSRPPSSSCSRVCISRVGSTRTAPARAASSTADDRQAPVLHARFRAACRDAMTAAFTPDPGDLDAPTAVSASRDRLVARAARYARWDGTQTIPAFDADEIRDALAA